MQSNEIQKIYTQSIGIAYDSLDIDETNNIDRLALEMEKNLRKNHIRLSLGDKAYREILVKLYAYLTNQRVKLVERKKDKIITIEGSKAYWEIEKEENEWRSY